MKLMNMKCTRCGATLDFDSNKEFIVCNYCGEKLLVDDETKRIEINENKRIEVENTININDNAAIKNAESNSKIAEMQINARSEESTRKTLLIILAGIWALILVVGIALIVFLAVTSH